MQTLDDDPSKKITLNALRHRIAGRYRSNLVAAAREVAEAERLKKP
jgi:hypothetical protein